MSKKVYNWGHERRFNTYPDYFRKIFGERVQKVSIDAGFTCPNRDGLIAKGGCTYCNNNAFNPSYCKSENTVSEQIKHGIEFHKVRYRKATKYLAYFQAYSNTYAPLEVLKKIYREALEFPGMVGLVIGTRPDCVDDEKLDYLSKLAEKYYVIIEYGVESVYNSTLQRVNRGHTYEQSVEAIERTARKGIRVGAHFIFGLPGESRKQMLDEAGIISGLPLNNVKFHQLQIVKDTAISLEYKEHPERFELFTLEEYLDFIVSFIERLNPEFVVERITGEAPPGYLTGPRWNMKRTDQILNFFEQKLEKMDTWQGRRSKK